MKNLKKLLRKNLKTIIGADGQSTGKIYPGNGIGNGDSWHCCNKTTGTCGPCGGAGACDEGYELRFC
ncbi:bacteriocin-like protein [Chryseobacterium populi]|uniref:Uncharacterized protein n=1 Tax=Chryseobacterium populi TaxID=1144316 RepID=J2KFC0_9FLAO|nr:hypothetical protein PMI13_02175 [Chryseobacterium populi]